METQWLPVSLVVWFTALAGVLDARQQGRFVQLGTGLLFARGRRTVTSWLRSSAAGCARQALLLPARQRRSQDLSHRWGLAPHPSPPAPGRWAGHAAGLRHRRLAHQAVRAARRGLASITTPLRDRPGPRSSTATSGSVWPAWSDTRSGERSPCRSSRTCTSEPRMSAGWRPTTAGSSTPSWSWPPPRSSGWSSSWGPITRRSGW